MIITKQETKTFHGHWHIQSFRHGPAEWTIGGYAKHVNIISICYDLCMLNIYGYILKTVANLDHHYVLTGVSERAGRLWLISVACWDT